MEVREFFADESIPFKIAKRDVKKV